MDISQRLSSEGAQYRADYFEALRMLSEKPPRTTIPVNRSAVSPFNMDVVGHDFDPDNVHDVLQRITIQRTVHPMIREVFFEGASIGKAARNPYGPGWIASCSRKVLYWNVRDAALALYQEVRNG